MMGRTDARWLTSGHRWGVILAEATARDLGEPQRVLSVLRRKGVRPEWSHEWDIEWNVAG